MAKTFARATTARQEDPRKADRGVTVLEDRDDGTTAEQRRGHGPFYGNAGLLADWGVGPDGSLDVEVADAELAAI